MRRTIALLATMALTLLVASGVALAMNSWRGASAGTATPDSPIASESGWLAYQTDQRGFDKLHLVRVDGSHDHQIVTHLPGFVRHPDFSRDGSRLVFDQLTSEESADQTYVARADGSHARRIAPCKLPSCLGHWEPAFSPDGSHIAISTVGGPLGETGPAHFGIAIVDLKTEKVTQIVNHGGKWQDHFARWSPDGKRLVFWRASSSEEGGPTAVFIVNVDGTGLHRLTPWEMRAGDPDWSPKGNRIVFSTRPFLQYQTSGRSELYTMRPDGSKMRKLTSYGKDGPRATQPRWTPDGKAILYTRVTQAGFPRHIWVINRKGSTDVPVLTKKSIYTHPVLQPR
jgi:TolB protein